MSLIKSPQFSLKYAGLFVLVFSLLLYFIVIKPHFAFVKVTLYINTDHPGVMEIFPPLKKLGYTQENAKKIKFPRGDSGHIASIYYSKLKTPLRLDPTVRQGRVSISSIAFEHLGIVRKIEGADFEQYILDCEQAKCSFSSEGLIIESEGVDAKVMIKPAAVPLLSRAGLIALVVFVSISMLLLMLALRYVLAEKARLKGQSIARGMLILLALYYLVSSKAPVYNAALQTLGLMLVFDFTYLLKHHTGATIRQQSVSYISLFFAVIILLLGFSQSFTTLFVQDVRDTLQEPSGVSTPTAKLKKLRTDIEAAFTNNFLAKDTFINLDAKLKIFGFGFTPNSKSILGEDGWFFEGYGGRRVEQEIITTFDNITDYMGLMPFTDQELLQWKIVLEERYYWLKDRGISYVFALAPTKALVYPEKLPARIFDLKTRLNKQTRYDQLVQYLQKNSIVPVVDLKSSLWAVKNEHPWPLFYRTDFHWNFLGAFYAYRGIMETVKQHYPEYQLLPLEISDFRIEPNYEWAHRNFLTLAGLIPSEHRNDTYLKLYPLLRNKYDENSVFYTQGIYDRTMSGTVENSNEGKTGSSVRVLKNTNGKMDSIFIIGDSFSEKMAGYFSAHAKSVYNYRTVSRFQTAPIKQYKPQLVIQEILNMYILDKPPVNPPELQAVRLKYIGAME